MGIGKTELIILAFEVEWRCFGLFALLVYVGLFCLSGKIDRRYDFFMKTIVIGVLLSGVRSDIHLACCSIFKTCEFPLPTHIKS